MRATTFLVLLAVGVGAVAASDVTVLTTETFKGVIESAPALVEFYAPWCGHCKHLEPIYEKLATEVKGRGVSIAKVDCTAEKTLQQEQGIRGFPTLKLFKNGGKDVIDYRGNRDVPSFVSFLETNGVLGPAVPVPKPHLRYFESRGRAELIRLILEENGVEYEDSRLTWDQWIANEKSNTERYAFAQAPQLTIDNHDLVQSGAIARYLGRKYGLYGGDNLAQTQIDVVYGGFEDLRSKYSTLVYDKEFSTKRAEFETKTLPTWLPHFERLLTKKDGTHNAFFVGGKLSIADLEGWDVLSTIWELTGPAGFEKYPALTAFVKSIAARPNIAAYLKSPRHPVHAHGDSAFYNNAKAPGHPLP